MCGILAIASPQAPIELSDAKIVAMRDILAHRGPDGSGLWRSPHAVLAHRRLAVLDRTSGSAQPMVRGSSVLAYNGELYNEQDLRLELAREGARFETNGDTETVLLALRHWGTAALDRFRGMFALAYLDSERGTILLARDPLGIKPLYWMRLDAQIVAASEIPALLAHPAAEPRPDLVGVSAYLSTIRTVLGSRTMFAGVRSLRPGESLEFDLLRPAPPRSRIHDIGALPSPPGHDELRAIVTESIQRHLRSDVPLCSLLSGGLDSTIIAAVAKREVGELRTYCAGAEGGEDFAHAARVAQELRTSHSEVLITREAYLARWAALVREQGVPLSTPNEVAIHEVSRAMRARGEVVTLSGEGADELFGGYAYALAEAARFHREQGGKANPVEFELASNAWVPWAVKGSMLTKEAWAAMEEDGALRSAMGEAMAGAEGVEAHLTLHRRVNLPGLLQRLDSATMRASVEGRTPLADQRVYAAAMAYPIEALVDLDHPERATASKQPLRRAFAEVIPPEVLERPKASFPLPFQAWCAGEGGRLLESEWLGRVVRGDVLAGVAADPETNWRLAWPLLNLASWARCWFEGAR